MVNYYQPNLSSKLQPLYNLLKKHTKISWTKECEIAFNKIKNEITSTRVLVPCDSKLPLTLTIDASPTGIGTVLSHIMTDGIERPIAFASRALNKSEKNYKSN